MWNSIRLGDGIFEQRDAPLTTLATERKVSNHPSECLDTCGSLGKTYDGPDFFFRTAHRDKRNTR